MRKDRIKDVYNYRCIISLIVIKAPLIVYYMLSLPIILYMIVINYFGNKDLKDVLLLYNSISIILCIDNLLSLYPIFIHVLLISNLFKIIKNYIKLFQTYINN